MVKALETYIVTNGNGKEAVEFYKNIFNAEVTSLKTWKDMNLNCPVEHQDMLINAQLEFDGLRLQLSDENPEHTFPQGKNMSVAAIVDSIEEAQAIYDGLKVNAQEISLELQETFFSPAYANLVDQYGVMWQINTELGE